MTKFYIATEDRRVLEFFMSEVQMLALKKLDFISNAETVLSDRVEAWINAFEGNNVSVSVQVIFLLFAEYSFEDLEAPDADLTPIVAAEAKPLASFEDAVPFFLREPG